MPRRTFLVCLFLVAFGARVGVGALLLAQGPTEFVLASDDGGHTWREAHDRIRFAAIDRVQFVDSENGWAAGEKVSPLPQDPFLLLTTDGGKTWRSRPIFDEAADNRLGSIQQFTFAGKNGSLIVDRGVGSDPGGGHDVAERDQEPRPAV